MDRDLKVQPTHTPVRRLLSFMLAMSLGGVVCISGCLALGEYLESVTSEKHEAHLAFAQHESQHDCCPAPTPKDHRENNSRISCCGPDGQATISPRREEQFPRLVLVFFVAANEPTSFVTTSKALPAVTVSPPASEPLYIRNRVFRI